MQNTDMRVMDPAAALQRLNDAIDEIAAPTADAKRRRKRSGVRQKRKGRDLGGAKPKR